MLNAHEIKPGMKIVGAYVYGSGEVTEVVHRGEGRNGKFSLIRTDTGGGGRLSFTVTDRELINGTLSVEA